MLQQFSKVAVFVPCTLCLCGVLLISSVGASAAEPSPKQLEFFEEKIRPVLVKHCYECHSAKSKPPKGNLLLDSRDGVLKGGDSGPSVVPSKVVESLLIDAIRYDGLEMPPNGKLPAAVIADFEKWVGMGMPDSRVSKAAVASKQIDYAAGLKFWAFQKPTIHEPPPVKNKAWPTSNIDRFVLARLEEQGLQPVSAADRRTLIRRAYFDLIGLPPSPAEVDTFVIDSESDAFVKVIDRLLDSDHYGERWGRRWLDVARYGEDQAHTFKARKYPRGYLYRDWVVQALNADMPYDQFLTNQVAGDLIDKPNRRTRLPALGLFALGPVYYQDNGEKDKALADEWDDRVDTLIRGTQSLTISCARCHDHKYDPFSMADYYGLLGIFASSKYQDRPVVSDEVVESKRKAEAAVKDQQLVIDRFLAEESRHARSQLTGEISNYMLAAWKVKNRQKANPRDRKAYSRIAKSDKLSEELIKRWVAYLDEKKDSGAIKSERPYLDGWRALIGKQDPKKDLSNDKQVLAAVRSVAEEFQRNAETVLPRRKSLFQHFGENVAFVSKTDAAKVVFGVVPLGNLFDDKTGTSLDAAIASDRFKAIATAESLGVDRVVQGWGPVVKIAGRIHFRFNSLGSDSAKYGGITNDGWSTSGGIQTQAKRAAGNLPRTEQGIGMHANALITFDLNEIRRAGLMPANKPLVFKVDRAGLNDDVFGNSISSVNVAVIVSKPHVKQDIYDAVIAGYVNGQPAKVEENDKEYYFADSLPKPLKADGKFVSFAIPLAPEAAYLTLVVTGAKMPGDANNISSDHAVFSGARIEFQPDETNDAAVAEKARSIEKDEETTLGDLVQARVDALLLSELLYDKGVLAVPPKETEAYLTDHPKQQLSKLMQELAGRRKAAAAINVLMAHSLTEGTTGDMKIYLAGDPKKKGDVAPRGFPAIFTGGKRQPFNPSGSGRLELAQAIASSANPLTARVMVNRVWAGHFGEGLVRTQSNFGQLGERPTHPLLLDHLAVRFMESGWSLKTLHRKIMLSATYQLSSRFETKNYEADPENRLIWGMNRRRLEVEPWRDAMLAVSGNLDAKLGGPSINLTNAGNKRRTLYGFVSRHKLDDLLRLFDFPDPNITAAKRSVTTVPLQQLFVLNSDFMVNQAKALSARLHRENESETDRIQNAYQLLFARPATEEETKLGLGYLKAAAADTTPSLSAWEQYTLVLLGSNEFAFLD